MVNDLTKCTNGSMDIIIVTTIVGMRKKNIEYFCITFKHGQVL